MFVMKKIEDRKTILILGLYQANNLIELSDSVDYTAYLKKHLYVVKYELLRQLKLLDKKTLLD